jgi:hypothetical protein
MLVPTVFLPPSIALLYPTDKELFMSEDKNYARCKACDSSFYPAWRKDVGMFEDLCHRCLPIALYAAISDDEYVDEDATIVQRVTEESEVYPDLYAEDEYLSAGEWGGLDFLDRY